MVKTKLTEKEKLFCYLTVLLKNPIEATIRAGYPPKEAEIACEKLLGNAVIQKMIKALSEMYEGGSLKPEVMGGLRRIAFGASNDAVRLLVGEENITDDDIRSLDLFGVSEIKRQKGGGLEIKFFDRLKALELLLLWSGKEAGSNGSIYDAIVNSAVFPSDGADNSDAV